MRRIVPESWMPACTMQRIITHWTAGGYEASDNDREHYHILIEGDGHLVRGDHTIRDNVSTGDDDYAAHVRGLNTASIGITVCCMAGAIERPFRPGGFPMRRKQYEVLVTAVADLCEQYGIAVTRETVLGHGEVQATLGKPQGGKWDPMVLPWDPGKSAREVGDGFRAMVRDQIDSADSEPDPQLPPVTIILDEVPLTDEAMLEGGSSWCPVRLLADRLGWTILDIDADSTLLRTPFGDREVKAMIRGNRGFVQVVDLCARLALPAPVWDGETRRVRIQSRPA